MSLRANFFLTSLRAGSSVPAQTGMEDSIEDDMQDGGAEIPVFVCPCTFSGQLHNTYASVLAVGVNGVAGTLADIRSYDKPPIANMSSYCMACKRITPSFHPARTVAENVLHWQRKRAFYVSCEHFISAWPKYERGKRARQRKKKIKIDEEGAV